MPAERRRLLVVLAFVVLLGAVAWTYFGSGTPARPAAARAGSPPPRNRQAAASTDALPAAESVRLSSLEHDREEPPATTRNPFKFERRASAAKPADAPAPVFAPAPAEPAAPTGPPPPPPIPLKFIGVLEQGGGSRWAVLSLGDARAPLHGKEGDIIDGRYRILKIGTESIEMAYLDGRGKQTIRLTGQ
jgi:hypothetical protein